MYKDPEELISQQYQDQSEQKALPSNQLQNELASGNTKELFKIKINKIVRNPESEIDEALDFQDPYTAFNQVRATGSFKKESQAR